MLTGENGIIKQVAEAKEKTEEAKLIEEAQMYLTDLEIEEYSNNENIPLTDEKYFNISDDGVITGNKELIEQDNIKILNIPSTINGIEAKIIGNNAFDNCDNIEIVNINEGIEEIRYYAFHYCSKLEKIKLSETLKTIGVSAFEGCRNLKYIEIPKNVIEIGEKVFNYSNVEIIKINKIQGSLNFDKTLLKDNVVIIWNNATEIKERTFRRLNINLFVEDEEGKAGTCDVKVVTDIGDFCRPYKDGTKYRIDNFIPADGYTYSGQESYTGVIDREDISIDVFFEKIN